MQASNVDTVHPDVSLIVQGFKADDNQGFAPYVFVGAVLPDDITDLPEVTFDPEQAHILSEVLRQHAEYAATAAEQGDK